MAYKKAKETGEVRRGLRNYASCKLERMLAKKGIAGYKRCSWNIKKAINPLRLTKRIFFQTAKPKEN